MELKQQFINEMLLYQMPFSHLCKKYGISEKTGYKWKKRFLEYGNAGLLDQSRQPLCHPNQIDGDTAAELIALKTCSLSMGTQENSRVIFKKLPKQRNPIAFKRQTHFG